MRELAALSGPWTGYWIQGDMRGDVTIDMSIEGNRLIGRGSDFIDIFFIEGAYDDRTREVRLLMSYPTHQVHHKGVWDGLAIRGRWTIDNEDALHTGPFIFHPDDGSADEPIDEAVLEEAEREFRDFWSAYWQQ